MQILSSSVLNSNHLQMWEGRSEITQPKDQNKEIKNHITILQVKSNQTPMNMYFKIYRHIQTVAALEEN